jgi:hypothetical protein
MSETPKIRRSSEADQFDADNELWDSKQLGASSEHAVRVSDERDKELDDAMGLQLFTFRMPKLVIEQLKQLAKLDGIGYQPFMRKVLIDYVHQNEQKLEQVLTPREATQRADSLFTQAIKLREEIPDLTPLSNKRVFAECDYNKALTDSNALFCDAYEKCSDPVLKQHIKLRLSQITKILDQELKQEHRQKYGKAG